MTNGKKNDFESVEGGEIIRVGDRNKAKKDSKIYIILKRE